MLSYCSTVVGDYINTIKTAFDFNFDLYQAFKQHGYKENPLIKKNFSLIICKLEILKKLVNNKNLNQKVVFIILVLSPTTVDKSFRYLILTECI